MQLKKLFAPMMLLALAGLTACGPSGESGNNNPVGGEPNGGLPTDPNGGNGDDGNGNINPPVPTSYPTLGENAHEAYPIQLYPAWNQAHFVKMENEAVYYAGAGDFNDVFVPGMYEPAGRVMWNVQSTSGYYGRQCSVEESSVPGMKRRACTVSEGTGYGMLISYFAGDTDTYNRIWNYSRAFRDYYGQKLTPWITRSFYYDMVDVSSATDADLDIATSLILMYFKYPGISVYLEDALTIINAIWDEEVNKTSYLLYSGNTSMWNGTTGDPVYNLSYFSPVALRLFAIADKAHDWTKVLNSMYDYMIKVQGLGTGVVPDWSNELGLPVNPKNGSADKTYWTFNKESVRVPWRIAWDYYWFQDPRDAQILKKLNDFIVAKTAGDPTSTMLAYNYSANLDVGADITGSVIQAHWAGAWCLTGMGTNQDWLNKCTDAFNARNMSLSSSSYFLDILQMSMSQLLNGLYVKPAGL